MLADLRHNRARKRKITASDFCCIMDSFEETVFGASMARTRHYAASRNHNKKVLFPSVLLICLATCSTSVCLTILISHVMAVTFALDCVAVLNSETGNSWTTRGWLSLPCPAKTWCCLRLQGKRRQQQEQQSM